MQHKIQILLTMLLLTAVTTAFAQDKGPIQLTMLAQEESIVLNDKGEREIRREEATNVIPGDHVLYTIQYRNIGAEATDDVVVNNAVPENTMYVDGTATGEGTDIVFSVDGGKTFDTPKKLTVKDADGNDVPAQAKDYTNIRWKLKQALAPGAEGDVSYRVELE